MKVLLFIIVYYDNEPFFYVTYKTTLIFVLNKRFSSFKNTCKFLNTIQLAKKSLKRLN